ncbi:hypothetical protein PWP93_33165 [Paraburkholderia sp. A1RI-2L]|uniref:hypothetical protein n=1 Tax=Paraburkholderia sp. A1RI-2L TaxID=3028367 RepID=UPI003B767591
MDELLLDSVEFTFFAVGLDHGEVEHRAMFIGTLALPVVVIFRSDGKGAARIAFDVPRRIAQANHYTNHADVVRDAIGQAARDDLFDHPPDGTVCLDGAAPRWAGNLKLSQRQMDVEQYEPVQGEQRCRMN